MFGSVKSWLPAAFAAFAISLTSMPQAVAQAPSWADPELLAKGRAEGTLTVYGSMNEQEAGASNAGGTGGRALGSSPSGEPLGCAESLSTPATQPEDGQEGQATRLWSSSTTVCITNVAYTPVEVFKITWHLGSRVCGICVC